MRTLSLRFFGIGFGVLLSLAFFSASPAKADTLPPGWGDTGVTTTGSYTCFDATQPNTLYGYESGSGTYALNFRTGQKTSVSPNPYSYCWQETGLFYFYDRDTTTDFLRSIVRFSRAEPEGRSFSTDHIPTVFAHDGSLQVYSTKNDVLFASADGGETWHNGGYLLPCAPPMLPYFCETLHFFVSQADGRAAYKLNVDTSSTYGAALYFSPDGGRTWQKRNFPALDPNPTYTYTDFGIAPLSGSIAPVNALTLTAHVTITNPNTHYTYDRYVSYLSVDGGRTYRIVGEWYDYTPPLFVTPQGILRAREFGSLDGQSLPIVSRSVDGGQTWQSITVPYSIAYVEQADASPSTLFGSTDPDARDHPLFVSYDSGSTWQEFGEGCLCSFQISPYLPITLVRQIYDKTTSRILISSVGVDGKGQTAPVAASDASGSVYFPQTGHNMSQFFSQFWRDHGGLAQFGYPKTEAFRELNPADNHIYVVQYFERARMEYHPEAPPEYRVLLGLLGNQLTAGRHEEVFNRTPDKHYGGGTYFPQTGHNLRNDFKKYWEAHGGLAIYGYPKSEEFYEVNPDDGKTYVVQYFERNRFEWHPDNTGTPYEVLLGLLGNTTLHNKGWL